eukprot:CAMPEP_0116571626 /NCGR_PEP_ID=MMETSP0397-20121206/17678_1 /TAXON_ID=216820 /ORGANISM="Cyclophora tenuis, Strain ECT3854" /LENGTH=62 /DNA_ID=CAMNT_0004099771 /DNA_START=60 /DNA_END=248 /DNA_ORIENTATION=+
MSFAIGNTVLSDGLHLNSVGGTVLRDLIVDYLLQQQQLLQLPSSRVEPHKKPTHMTDKTKKE